MILLLLVTLAATALSFDIQQSTSQSVTVPCAPAWNPSQSYQQNSIVSFNNINYISKWWENAGSKPGSESGDAGWLTQAACVAATGAGHNSDVVKAIAKTTTKKASKKTSTKKPTKTTKTTKKTSKKTTTSKKKTATPKPTKTTAPPPPPPPPPGGIPTTLAQHRAYAASKSTSSVLKQLKHSTRTNPTNIDKITPGNPSNPENVKRVEKILTPAKWKHYFSMADPAYTYTNFLKSVAFFSGFCDTYPGKDSDTICKKLLATMFAHFAQETGAHDKKSSIPEWRQSLVYLREISCTETNTISGCFYNGDCTNPVFNTVFTCGKGSSNGFKAYFGRGAHQLSYSFNYGPFSEVMFNGDPTVLLNKPELVADTWLNLASAIFFFIYPQPPKPSMLWVMDGTYVPNAADLSAGRVNDFPSTIQIINGECAGSSTSNAAQNRINYYTAFMKDMGLDTKSSVLKCAGMGAFDSSSSAGKTEMYWVADYSGKPVCQLVPYQTNFNALMDGVGFDQYVKCVETSFKVKLK